MKSLFVKQLLLIFLVAMLPLTSIAAPDFWIDVRSEGEYDNSHVSGAINIPYDQITRGIAGITRDKDAQIYLYCVSGGRAGTAMKDLQSLGYTQVTNVGGLEDALKLKASSKP